MPTELTPSSRDFLRELEDMKDEAVRTFAKAALGRASFGDPRIPPRERPEVVALLKAMVYPERVAADIMARRIPSIPHPDIKERVAQQVAEELNHLDILRRMLAGWGHDPDEMWHRPLPELVSIFDYVNRLETLAELFSANFIGESMLLSVNFRVMHAAAPEAFAAYLETSIPDEAEHVQLNREAIVRYATTAELQARARIVAARVLEAFIAGYVAKMNFVSQSNPLHREDDHGNDEN